MKILDIKATRGPSYWSVTRPRLIVMTLDIGKLEDAPSDTIPGMPEQIERTFPGMFNHQCSVGKPGGFFERLKRGTWAGHIAEHIAIELQHMAGIDVSFGQTRGGGNTGVYYVVFEYDTEEAGRYAAKAALNATELFFKGEEYDPQPDVRKIARLHKREKLGPSTGCIAKEAKKRGIPVMPLIGDSLLQFGYGSRSKRISAAMTSDTSGVAMEIAGDKDETKLLLDTFNIPVPRGTIVYNKHDLKEAISEIGYPVVIKPLDANQGKGVSANVRDWTTAIKGLLSARKYSKAVIVERYVRGFDHRLLVINGKLIAAAKRTPAMIVGDGRSSLRHLIERVNQDPRRGEGHENVLTKITVDDITHRILNSKGLGLDSVLMPGEVLYLKDTANLSTGGTAEDVTDQVHPDIVFMAEQISHIVGLDICGIDMITEDISLPVEITGGAVIEVNAAPGLRMHLQPSEGKPRPVAEAIIDMMFPEGRPYSIPIVAVTGTNGKTTTTRLIAHMAKMEGHRVGYTNTDGIYVQDYQIEAGDCSGPGSADKILKNPSVDFAVLECARGGILRSGLAFQFCHVGVVTNVSADHIGLGGIDTIEKLAKVKAVIPETVLPGGYAVLNAEDDLVYNMRENTDCRLALFSVDPDNARLLEHRNSKGLCATMEENYIILYEDGERIEIDSVMNVPLTMGGKAVFNIQNVLASVLGAVGSHISLEAIRKALREFVPSVEQTPGRLNLMNFGNFDLLLDYAHNTGAMKAIGDLIRRFDHPEKIGVISGVGDRRDEDIRELGALAAEAFDRLYIRLDEDMRGREQDDMVRLLREGIHHVKPGEEVPVIGTEKEAIDYILNNTPCGALVAYFSEKVDKALDYLNKAKKQAIKPEKQFNN